MADINKKVAFAFARNFSSLCSHMLCFCLCVLAKARKIASKSKCYLFINMSQYFVHRILRLVSRTTKFIPGEMSFIVSTINPIKKIVKIKKL
jgi:hypothetical protein